MAASGNRRRGFSRRAQYGFFISYVVAVGGMLVAVLLLAISIIDPRGFAALRGAALDATTPISTAGRSVGRFFGNIGSTVGDYVRAGSQNSRLERELAETRRELIRRQAQDDENRRLHALLGLAQAVEDEIVLARIVGSSFDSPRRLATLSAGTSSGVRAGQPVRAPDGLLGRVIETGRWAARILLITDGASSVPVRMVRDGTPALAVGRGDGTIELRTLSIGQNPFRRGDLIVTSGLGGIYPPDIPVAIVTGQEGDSIIARPLADPSRADFAIVQPVYQPAATGALDDAREPDAGPPVAAPPPAARPAAPAPDGARQNDPRYQPGLQRQPVRGEPPARVNER